jgi:hypothetical protein
MKAVFIKILLLIFIFVMGYLIYQVYINQYNLNHGECNIDNFDIDDLVVIKRTPEYSSLINGLVDKKSFIFTDEQLKVLKNPQQIFNVKNNQQDIKNISGIVYTNCEGKFDSPVNNDFNDNPIDLSNNEYAEIKTMLQNDIQQITEPNCFNTGVLRNDIPTVKNYLKNYYQDIYGNRIEANLLDYFVAYRTLINNEDNVGFPVNTQIGNSNFIIPDQFEYQNQLTNAYNIDWDRIINPLTYSM